MPRGSGTGPPGGGQGRKGGSEKGSGKGRLGGTSPGSGPAGECICPSCGERVSHKAGVPCYQVSCPKCGTKMVRA